MVNSFFSLPPPIFFSQEVNIMTGTFLSTPLLWKNLCKNLLRVFGCFGSFFSTRERTKNVKSASKSSLDQEVKININSTDVKSIEEGEEDASQSNKNSSSKSVSRSLISIRISTVKCMHAF